MLEEIKKIHFIGIGGIGMSALAKFFLAKGKEVSGSDLHSSEITDELIGRKVAFHDGHATSSVPEDVDLVIYSAAIPENNVERVRARDLGVREMSYAEFLGEMSKWFSTIVVTGTHGKSTTTAMLALILEEAGYDPTVIVGSKVPSFPDGNLRIGSGRFFVVEGCEYQANMLQLTPEMIVLTNIEEDHLDFYKDIDHIRETFQKFADKLIGRGMVVWNADDTESNKLTITRGVSYGLGDKAQYTAKDRETASGSQQAKIIRKEAQEELLGELKLVIPGTYNLMDALAAVTAAMEIGVPFETCAKVLERFSGIWRRFEHIGEWHGAHIISDYGHHPTEISAALKAAKEFYPGRRIVLCFQPHQHARTIALLDELAEAVQIADEIVIPEIYEVAGRTEDEQISSKDLVKKVKEAGKKALYAKDFKEAEEHLRNTVKEDDIVIIQGAGDIDDLARKLVV